MKPKEIKALVKAARLPAESRAEQAKRLDIPYVTLRRMEIDGLVHRNTRLHEAYVSALRHGIPDGAQADKAVAKC